MDRLSYILRNTSIKLSLAIYVVIFTLIAIVLSGVTFIICNEMSVSIESTYKDSSDDIFYLTNQKGERLGEGVGVSSAPVNMSDRDKELLRILKIAPLMLIPTYFTLSMLCVTIFFYSSKLKKPLDELNKASKEIANNNLDFQLSCESTDELGSLIQSFELMRETLEDNFAFMWRKVEERKKVNAAFSHELRTPITVIKGYTEMLLDSDDQEVKEMTRLVLKHITRIENYVSSMSKLSSLEEMLPNYEKIEIKDLIEHLKLDLEILSFNTNKNIKFSQRAEQQSVYVDEAFVRQVFHNLLANALRYAEQEVIVELVSNQKQLKLIVVDDGIGFNLDDLPKLMTPFYTKEKLVEGHFGLGLYISQMLCNKHDGELVLANGENGAKSTAFFKYSKS